MMGLGAQVPDGQLIRMPALPGVWRCFHGGSPDDPDFNNVHLEVRQD
jgi:hypothetical protein